MLGVQVVNVNYEEGSTMMGTRGVAKYVVEFVMGVQEGRFVWEPRMFLSGLVMCMVMLSLREGIGREKVRFLMGLFRGG